jgi:iron complex outermembrane receptor protein
LNADWRYVDPLPSIQVPAYQTMDVRVAWCPSKSWELAVTGRNLFSPKHLEFISPYLEVASSMVERSYLLSLAWKW